MNSAVTKPKEPLITDSELFNNLMTISSLTKSLAKQVVIKAGNQNTRINKYPNKKMRKERRGYGCI